MLETVIYLTNHQNATHMARIWAVKVIMALANIVRKTGVLPPSNDNALQVMLSYLCLEESRYEHVVGKMDESLRLTVLVI